MITRIYILFTALMASMLTLLDTLLNQRSIWLSVKQLFPIAVPAAGWFIASLFAFGFAWVIGSDVRLRRKTHKEPR
ncbi:hypothetical protein ACFFSY_11675 [Paenibacillus aurantiacus]|uniref:DUF1049 domain-containing protein n=1 Tax=Paenibacillus aurantiacus TaxID=1936118 RepID=A0ABV5KMY4_9BACL